MKIAAAIPVNGRHRLLKHTIIRLLTKCGVDHVVCTGSKDDRDVCRDAGAEFIQHPNHPLGFKWNRAFQACEGYDAVLFVGSSDWVSDDWVKTMLPYLETNYMVGKLGCHLLDIQILQSNLYRLVYWPGYEKGTRQRDPRRHKEPIGIGRMLSREFLKKISYRPFKDNQDASLDWVMYEKANGRYAISEDNVHSLSISTNLWPNKHKFSHHWMGMLPSKRINASQFCDQYFPEYKLI
jgi:hypothetical protein